MEYNFFFFFFVFFFGGGGGGCGISVPVHVCVWEEYFTVLLTKMLADYAR